MIAKRFNVAKMRKTSNEKKRMRTGTRMENNPSEWSSETKLVEQSEIHITLVNLEGYGGGKQKKTKSLIYILRQMIYEAMEENLLRIEMVYRPMYKYKLAELTMPNCLLLHGAMFSLVTHTACNCARTQYI